ncbi:MAG: PLP-dependent aspartate aminotransferase family protein [Acidimicrobiia bacterium]
MVHHLQTRAVAAGRPDGPGAPLNEPLVPASNFLLDGARAYARDDGTPTWAAFEAVVGALEAAEAVAFGSGMAAIAAVFDLLPVGAHIVWPDDCYQGVAGLIAQGERLGRWRATRLAVQDTDAWCAAAASADLLWVESPSNPLLTVADLHRIAAAPRPSGSILAVDNTLAGPAAQQPLELGADVSVQSATKHLGGHSDLLCGVAATRRAELAERLRHNRELHGATPGALETYLATRGLRTYPLRAAASAASAVELAHRLAGHHRVELVRYPGLASHPTHDVARRQLAHYGSVISFDVVGGAAAADAVCARVGLVRHATSFGAVESTIERRAAVPGQEHLPPGLLRLSVGIEHTDDLWADLDAALGGL